MGCGGTLVVFRIDGTVAAPLRFGADFELDPRAYQLRRAGRPLRLERIPMELLLLLVAQRGQLVTREQIIEAIWGKDVFVDVDASINSAVRKIRQVLKDDAERPRFLQTVTGRGYRFIAPVLEDEPAPAIEAGGQDLPAPQTPAPQHRRTLRVGALVALGAALVIALGLVARAVFTGPPVTIRSIAVLPLENLTGDGTQDYFTDGMTDALTTTLAQIESLRVISHVSDALSRFQKSGAGNREGTGSGRSGRGIGRALGRSRPDQRPADRGIPRSAPLGRELRAPD